MIVVSVMCKEYCEIKLGFFPILCISDMEDGCLGLSGQVQLGTTEGGVGSSVELKQAPLQL